MYTSPSHVPLQDYQVLRHMLVDKHAETQKKSLIMAVARPVLPIVLKLDEPTAYLVILKYSLHSIINHKTLILYLELSFVLTAM